MQTRPNLLGRMKIYFCVLCTVFAYTGPLYSQLTATEQLIKDEILRLGGDWEGKDSPRLVEFIGPRFQSKHFELLTHIPTVEVLCLYRCKLDAAAFLWIQQASSLKRIEITDCEISEKCFPDLSNNRMITVVNIGNTDISPSFLRSISTLNNLQELNIECSLVPAGIDENIAAMKRLKSCAVLNVANKEGAVPESYSKGNLTFKFISRAQLGEIRRDSKQESGRIDEN